MFALPTEGQSILKTSNSSKAYRDFYYPGSIIGAFFRHATICALFYIFYQTINICLDVLTTGTKPPRWIKNLHWGILGVILITAIIDWAFYIQQMLSQKSRSTGHSVKAMTDIVNRMYDIELACSIIRWISSMEVLAWTIYLATKATKTRAKIRASIQGILRLYQLPLISSTSDTLDLPPFQQRIPLCTQYDVGHLLYQPLCHHNYSNNDYLRRRSNPDHFHTHDLSRTAALLREMGPCPLGQP